MTTEEDNAVSIPRDRAVKALAVTLAARVTIEHRSFVRGDMCVRERDAERLFDLATGTFKARKARGKLAFTVYRDGVHSWYSLFEIADTMLDGRDGNRR